MDKIVIPKKTKEQEAQESESRQKVTWLKGGVHLAKIVEVKKTRDAAGAIKLTQGGDEGIDVVFNDKEGRDFTETFWTSEKAMWRVYKLLKDAKVNYHSKDATPADIIGKKVWLVLADEVQVENGKIKMKASGDKEYEVSYVKFVDTKPVENVNQPPVYAADKLRIMKEVVSSGAPAKSAAPTPKTAEKVAKAPAKSSDFPPPDEEEANADETEHEQSPADGEW